MTVPACATSHLAHATWRDAMDCAVHLRTGTRRYVHREAAGWVVSWHHNPYT